MNTKLSASGKALSTKNSQKLKAVCLELISVLVESGETDFAQITNMLRKSNIFAEKSHSTPEEIMAGTDLKDVMSKIAWSSGLSKTTMALRELLFSLKYTPGKDLEGNFGTSDRVEIFRSIVDKFQEWVIRHVESMPEPSDGDDWGIWRGSDYINLNEISAGGMFLSQMEARQYFSSLETAFDYFRSEIMYICAVKSDDVEIIFNVSDRKQALISCINDFCEYLKEKFFPIDALAELESSSKAEQMQVKIQCSVLQAKAGDFAKHLIPFEGVLFTVGEPSESAPEKGSDLPLFVSKEIANDVIAQINASGGLPLDVSADFSKHDKDNIVGIMNRAELIDNNLKVYGHLFGWNQEEQVRRIAASKDLGMSMNAHAYLTQETIGGVDCSVIQNIQILGANILRRNRATYQKTEAAVIAAAANSTTIAEEEEMDIKELQQTVLQMNQTLTSIENNYEQNRDDIGDIKDLLRQHSQVISEIQAEKSARLKEQEAAIEAQSRQKQTDTLLAQVKELITSEIAPVRNYLNNQQRIPGVPTLQDLVPSGENQEVRASAVSQELKECELRLQVLRDNNINPSERIQLVERISYLKKHL